MASIREPTECDGCFEEKTTVTDRGTPEEYDGGDRLCLSCRREVWDGYRSDYTDEPDGGVTDGRD